jgi:hypothetical protein
VKHFPGNIVGISFNLAARVFAIAAIVSGATSYASAACKQRICVHGSDDNGVHEVWIESEFKGVTHYNVRFPDGRQHEVSADDTRFSYRVKSGRKYRYGVQACVEGGFLDKSGCNDWVSFSHTVD